MKIEKQVMFTTTLRNGEIIAASSEKELEELYKIKTERIKRTVKFTFPLILKAGDRHEFDDIARVIKQITGEKIYYKEFFNSRSEFYWAVFWNGEVKPVKEIESKIRGFLADDFYDHHL